MFAVAAERDKGTTLVEVDLQIDSARDREAERETERQREAEPAGGLKVGAAVRLRGTIGDGQEKAASLIEFFSTAVWKR